MDFLQEINTYIETLLKDKLSSAFLYHNYIHTLEVVHQCEIIAIAENLPEDIKEKLLVAAWFHDTGYIYGTENHETESAKIARSFLSTRGKDEDYIQDIERIILATSKNYQAERIEEKIIQDADLGHLASSDYTNLCKKLRKEWELTQKTYTTDEDWTKENYHFLSTIHPFHTQYAQDNWNKQRDKNLKKVKKELDKLNKKDTPTEEAKTLPKSDRSIDTMFRITLNNHNRLSNTADSKANILLSVNAIIISISLSTIVPKLDSPNNAHLVIPTFTMLFFSVLTIIFAILSTKPKITTGNFTHEDLRNGKINLLFFGNFFKIPMDDYVPALRDLMEKRDELYDSMIKDLYYLGLVLNKKYRLLSITYKIFMFEIIISVVAFAYAFWSI
ncbi:Pycsar system effector family protein [Elizabethkingia sp. JS20170427COW]|uniref:Pycsar system effector family protein n=1 Tax=Elizabethkingia sp. JS20170427COW TaxID=2583851 RepID=UPI00111054B5|nr:Pycsar system effector family protein [Elizabethkingia sp. JS20170427COW]QCX53614.1 HD domain-containing protein [Elizabethkingia sp. JS20170427COW]